MRSVAIAFLILGCAKSRPAEQYRYTPAQPHVTRPPVQTEVSPPGRKPYDFRYPIRTRDDPFSESFDTHPDVPAARISGSDPKLPDEARKAKVSGIVILEIGIDEKGRPAGYHVLKPLPFGLTEAAVAAVRTWRFKPAIRDGQPVRSIQNVTLRFGS